MRAIGAGLSKAETRLIAAVLIALVAAALIVPAMTLRANGLWTDELFTNYFSDPSLGWGAAAARAAEDVHPPAYALLVRLLRRITGADTEIAARGLALVCSAATIGILGAALRSRMGRLPVLFTLAAVALSGGFLSVVAEARSYALAEFLVTIDIVLLLRLLPWGGGLRGGLPLAVLLIIGGVVHSYLALVGMALSAYLVLIARDWRPRAGWALVAALTAIMAQAVAHWQAPYVVPDLSRTWLSAAIRDQAEYLILGGLLVVASPLGIAALLLAIPVTPWRRVREWAADPRATLATPCGLAVFAITATAGAAVAYTTFVTPVLSRRLFLVIAPFFWLLAAEVFRLALRRPGRVLPAVLLGLAIIGGLRIPDAGQQQIEPWRASARAIAALPGCAGAPIFVVGFDQPYVRGGEAATFYGHYLPSSARALQLIPRNTPPAIMADRVLAARSTTDCPVLLWSVHHMRGQTVFEVAAILRHHPRLPPGFAIRVDGFPASLPVGSWPHFGRAVPSGKAFIVRLVPLARSRRREWRPAFGSAALRLHHGSDPVAERHGRQAEITECEQLFCGWGAVAARGRKQGAVRLATAVGGRHLRHHRQQEAAERPPGQHLAHAQRPLYRPLPSVGAAQRLAMLGQVVDDERPGDRDQPVSVFLDGTDHQLPLLMLLRVGEPDEREQRLRHHQRRRLQEALAPLGPGSPVEQPFVHGYAAVVDFAGADEIAGRTHHPGKCHHDGGFRRSRRQLARQLFRQPLVIIIQERDPGACRGVRPAIARRPGAPLLRVADDLQPLVRNPAEGRSGRRIVAVDDNDHLEIRNRL